MFSSKLIKVDSFKIEKDILQICSKQKSLVFPSKCIVDVSREVNDNVILTYVKRYNENLLKLAKQTLVSESSKQNQLFQALAPMTVKRQRNFLCFFNPFGGRKQAENIFKTKVVPIFNVFNIKYKLVETISGEFVQNYFQNFDTSMYDSIICIGGDGLVNQVVFTLYKDRIRDNLKVDVSERNTDPIPTIGIIPAGSTDTVAYSLNGNNDPQTLAIRICLEDKLKVDVGAIYLNQNFSLHQCFLSLCGYGFHGNIIENSEKLRWLGPMRYDVSGFTNLLENQHYRGQLRILKEHSTINNQNEISQIFLSHNLLKNFAVQNPDKVIDIKGEFSAINAFNLACKCEKAPNGAAPTVNPSDGFMELMVVDKCGRIDFLQNLLHISNSKLQPFKDRKEPKHQQPLPFVKLYKTRGFSFHIDDNVPKTSGWCYDGELLKIAEIHCLIHRQLVELYGSDNYVEFPTF